MREARRVLKPGGRLLLSAPSISPLHGLSFDYYRWTQNVLRIFSEKNGFRVLGVFPTSFLLGVAANFISLSVVENVARGTHVIQSTLCPFFDG